MRTRENVEVIPALSNGCNRMIIVGEIVRRIRAILLTCKPGRRPVKIPVRTPRMQNVMSSINGNNVSIILSSPDLVLFYQVVHNPLKYSEDGWDHMLMLHECVH